MVDLLCRNSNNRGGAPALEELQVLLVSAGMGGRVEECPTPPHRIARRLDDETVAVIVAKYEAGATSHYLRAEYDLAQGSVLKILATHKVTRTRSLTDPQIAQAIELYARGFGIQRIADQISASYTGTRNALLRSGVEMRGRLEYLQNLR